MSKAKIYVISVLFAGFVSCIVGSVFYAGYAAFTKLLEYVSLDTLWFGGGSAVVIVAFAYAFRWSVKYNEKKEKA